MPQLARHAQAHTANGPTSQRRLPVVELGQELPWSLTLHLPRSLVLSAVLVVVTGVGTIVSDTNGALAPGATAWMLSAKGTWRPVM